MRWFVYHLVLFGILCAAILTTLLGWWNWVLFAIFVPGVVLLGGPISASLADEYDDKIARVTHNCCRIATWGLVAVYTTIMVRLLWTGYLFMTTPDGSLPSSIEETLNWAREVIVFVTLAQVTFLLPMIDIVVNLLRDRHGPLSSVA